MACWYEPRHGGRRAFDQLVTVPLALAYYAAIIGGGLVVLLYRRVRRFV